MNGMIHVGDCIEMMRAMPDGFADCCVTSPPYWGLRDYGNDGQIGLEATPEEYVARIVDVFRDVMRVMRDDGVLWLNLGDSYNSAASGQNGQSGSSLGGGVPCGGQGTTAGRRPILRSLKPKDLVGIPWRVAFALQADGWYLRQDIIWHKPNPMPESVTDRCTKAHEYVFLLSKSARYYYDAEAIREPAIHAGSVVRNSGGKNSKLGTFGQTRDGFMRPDGVTVADTRNARSVWTIASQPYEGAHFATMPRDLAERCIRAGSRAGGTVLDPFAGAGTTGLVALRAGRNFVGCELNPEYAELARGRILSESPMFYTVAIA